MAAPKSIARFGRDRRRKHQVGCSRRPPHCDCLTPEAAAPLPIVCVCREDEEGYRWFNLGCRMHTRLWSPEWLVDRANGGTALIGSHLFTRQPTRRID